MLQMKQPIQTQKLQHAPLTIHCLLMEVCYKAVLPKQHLVFFFLSRSNGRFLFICSTPSASKSLRPVHTCDEICHGDKNWPEPNDKKRSPRVKATECPSLS